MDRRTLAQRMAAVGGALVVISALGLSQGWGASTTYSGPAEPPKEFLANYVIAVRTGDTGFLAGRVDPSVVEFFGFDQCRSAVAKLKDPDLALKLASVSGPEIRDFQTDGFEIALPDTYEFAGSGLINGTQQKFSFFFPLVDRHFRIVLDCGEPAAGS